MACFLVPAAEAVVVKVVEKASGRKHKKDESEKNGKIPFVRKLKWLANLLAGGSVLLAFEHLWHGEIVPWFPFLSAMSDPSDAAAMFREMLTVGVAMTALITVVWIVMCVVADIIARRGSEKKAEGPAE